MPYPFRTKESNLRLLNIGSGVWFSGLIVGGIFTICDTRNSHRLHDIGMILAMLAFGIIVYGVNRLGLSLSDRKRPTATEAEIEDARRMLYGEKPDRPQ